MVSGCQPLFIFKLLRVDEKKTASQLLQPDLKQLLVNCYFRLIMHNRNTISKFRTADSRGLCRQLGKITIV